MMSCGKRFSIRSLVGPLCVAVVCLAHPAVGDAEFVVEQEILPNGLRVWVSRLAPAERVLVRLVVRAGKADAAPRPRQTAHLLEHLLYQSRAGEFKE